VTLLPYVAFIGGCLASAGIGVLAANWLWRRREERLREEALEPFLEPIEPDHVGTFTNIRVPVNAVVRRPIVADIARVLRENSTPEPLSKAAE
jgi:hypothetical protein